MKPDLILPAIHLNGTGRTTLLHDYKRAYARLCEAVEAFNYIPFHARDYYVLPEGAWPQTQAEREVIKYLLGKAKGYLETHLVHLSEPAKAGESQA